MKLPLLGIAIDERFLTHRRRASSTAGIATGVLAVLIFAWRFYVDGRWSWDLFAVAITFVISKWALMAWYRWTD
ncbi:MAG: hypothetical protein ACE5IK_02340 [Acidobacteriota bacterium]